MAKERVSLTLDERLLERVDAALARQDIDNRSRGIEQMLRDHLQQASVTEALVLAGGEDPDCLVTINGRPVIAHVLDHLDDAGIETAYVATGDQDVIDTADDHALPVTFIEEDAPLGTAGPLREIRSAIDDTLLVVNGDVLCGVDIDDMVDMHEEHGGLATMAVTTVEDSEAFGVVALRRDEVVGFEEKPDEARSHLVNAGVYLIEPALIDRLPSAEEQRAVDIEPVFEALAEEGKLYGYVYDGEWREVGA